MLCVRKCNFVWILCMQLQWHIPWLAGHPLSLQNIIMLLSIKSHANREWNLLVALIECKQFTKMHTKFVFSFVGVVLIFFSFAPWGNFILVKWIHWLCIHIYIFIFLYSYPQRINMHSFGSFIDKKRVEQHNNVFIEIQCITNWIHSYEHWIYYVFVQ